LGDLAHTNLANIEFAGPSSSQRTGPAAESNYLRRKKRISAVKKRAYGQLLGAWNT